jgi:hypothetical protein
VPRRQDQAAVALGAKAVRGQTRILPARERCLEVSSVVFSPNGRFLA